MLERHEKKSYKMRIIEIYDAIYIASKGEKEQQH